jgi:WD40 repeat protein
VCAIPGSKSVVVTSTDGVVTVIDTEKLAVQLMDKTTHNERDISCMYVNKDYIVTGDSQGNVNIFSSRTLDRCAHINGSKKRKENSSSISCLFVKDGLVHVCKEDSTISMWDMHALRKTALAYTDEGTYVTRMDRVGDLVVMSCHAKKHMFMLNDKDWSVVPDSNEYPAPIVSFAIKGDHIAVLLETGAVVLSHMVKNKTLSVTECPSFSRFTTFDFDVDKGLLLIDFSEDNIITVDTAQGKITKKMHGFLPFKAGACFVGGAVVAFDYSGTMYKYIPQ